VVKYIILFCSIISANVMANSAPLVDPTKPLNHTIKPVKKEYRSALPKLQSILAEGGQRRAILNNQLYKTGQWVSGYQITRIESDAVLLRHKKHAYKLNLYTKEEHFVK
jgi:hypothetical protein